MGSYIHIGIGVRAVINAQELALSGDSDTQVGDWFRDHFVDPTWFSRRAIGNQIEWTLKPEFTGEPLVAFLEAQDAAAGLRESLKQDRAELYRALRRLRTWEEVLALTDLHQFASFYCYGERHYLGDGRYRRVPIVRTTLLVFMSEGKAVLECWTSLFKYLEHMIHLQAELHPIARAVKLAVG